MKNIQCADTKKSNRNRNLILWELNKINLLVSNYQDIRIGIHREY